MKKTNRRKTRWTKTKKRMKRRMSMERDWGGWNSS